MSTLQLINTRIEKQEFNYYGIMSVTIVLGTCLASVALMYMLINDAPVWEVATLAAVAMGSNAASISHSPLRWVVWAFIINVVISLLLLAINII